MSLPSSTVPQIAETEPGGLSRRQFGTRVIQATAATAVLGLAACGDGGGDTASGGGSSNPALVIEHPLGEITMGDPNAPVILVEYASYTCGHCAAFHAVNLPPLKENYIETGKVFYIFREYPLDPVATAASMLARCVSPDKYLQFAEVLFARQQQWAFVQDPRAALAAIARQGGISAGQFEACMVAFTGLEVLVAFLQAYVFAILTCIYLNDALHVHH